MLLNRKELSIRQNTKMAENCEMGGHRIGGLFSQKPMLSIAGCWIAIHMKLIWNQGNDCFLRTSVAFSSESNSLFQRVASAIALLSHWSVAAIWSLHLLLSDFHQSLKSAHITMKRPLSAYRETKQTFCGIFSPVQTETCISLDIWCPL